MSVHTAKRRKLTETDPPDIKKDLCNCLRAIDSDKSPVSVLDDHRRNLDEVLARWSKQDREVKSHSGRVYEKLVYVLEHKYSEDNIGLEQFTGKDKLRTRYLLEACLKQGFCFYFAGFEFSEDGQGKEDRSLGSPVYDADYYEFTTVDRSYWNLRKVFQYDGKQIAESVDLEEEDLIGNVDFTGIIPDEQDFHGYCGLDSWNVLYNATHTFFRTCAVIVPRVRLYDFLLHAGTVHVQGYVELLLGELEDDPSSVASQDELKRFCVLVSDPQSIHTRHDVCKVGCVTDGDWGSIGKAILRLDCPDLLENLARGKLVPVGLGLFKELGRGLVERDISLWHYGIDLAIWSIRTVCERFKAVDLLMSNYREAGGNDAATMQRMHKFEREWAINVGETFNGRFCVSPANAQALMQLSEKYGENYTFEVVIPIVKKHLSDVGFITAYLTMIFRAGETNTLRTEVVEKLFKDILANMIPDLNLHCPASPDFELSFPEMMSAENLAVLFSQCERLGLAHDIDKLATKIIFEASSARTATFERILLPLLKQLPPVVERGPNNTTTLSYVKIFRAVIPAYIDTYVQSPPQKPTGIEPQPCDCSLQCGDCAGLDAFLKSPDKVTTYFHNLSDKRSEHLEERLRGSMCSMVTTKISGMYHFTVTKRGLEWKNAMKEWNQRCDVALEKVEEIGPERLKSLLGEGWEVDCLPIFADFDLGI